MSRAFCLLVAGTCVASCVASCVTTRATPPSPETTALQRSVDSIAAAALETPLAGVVVGVVRGTQRLVWSAYGRADVESARALTTTDTFWVASLIKPLTASAVMRAVGDGRLRLDDTVGRWLPDAPAAARHVTVRQLLDHTAGVRNVATVPAWRSGGSAAVSPAELLSLVATDTLDFPAGSAWRYSNTNYVLLGRILEAATTTPFAEYLARTQFRPLRMSGSSVCGNAPGVKGYERREGRLVPASPLSPTRLYAAGAFCSTAADLVAWADAFMKDKVVSPDARAQMTTPAGPARTARIHYGFGIASDSLEGHRRWHHPGGIYGYSAHLAMFPDDFLIVVVLVNTGPGQAEPIAEKVARAAFARR
jgi:D-alanyl-D-alanine carboxypeptidase